MQLLNNGGADTGAMNLIYPIISGLFFENTFVA